MARLTSGQVGRRGGGDGEGEDEDEAAYVVSVCLRAVAGGPHQQLEARSPWPSPPVLLPN